MQIFRGIITNQSEAEALNALQYIQTNQGVDTQYATFDINSLEIGFLIQKNTFNEMVTTIQAFKAQFSSRLINWRFIYKA